MASIADVFFTALFNDKRLQIDAAKAGDKAGQTVGTKMSAGIASGLKKLAFGGLAAGFGLATKGLLELENITADFAAETGASADEAKRAGEAINQMAGRNLQPMAEIGKTLAKVHTDLGLTGDAAEATAEQFLKFGRATKQDATAAVEDFDDILDAWGLTAEDAQGIMDKLIVSHQEYGGSIEANQKALGKMAPQLKALNLSVDDSIGLFNLFATKGIDAAETQRALNTAIQNLPPGTSLQDFIAELSKIEDPAVRAKRAIEIFGSRGGVALANALGPGIDSLDDFKVTTEEAAGATAEAASALDSTFGARAQLLLKGFSSALIGLGKDFGPVLTGMASLASLGAALGLDKALAGGWQRVAGSGLVKGAIAKAGSMAATAYLASLIAGDKIGTALQGLWAKVATSGPIQAAVGGAGKVWGSLLGKAVAGAFIAVALVELAARMLELNNAVAQQQRDLLEQNKAFVAQATREQLEAARAGVQAQLDELNKFDFGEALFGSAARASSRRTLEQILSDIDQQLGTLPATVSGTSADAGKAIAKGLADGVTSGATQLGPAIRDGLERGLVSANVAKTARRHGNLAGAGIADGINEKRSVVDNAWVALMLGLKNAMTPTQERAKLLGHLASKELANGLKSGDPAVKEQARATKQLIIDRLMVLGANTKNIGKKSMDELKRAMKSKDPDIRAAARQIYRAATQPLNKIAPDAKADGKAAALALAAGLRNRAAQAAVSAAARFLASLISDHLRGKSPTKVGPLSEDGGIGGWAKAAGLSWAAEILGTAGRAMAAARAVSAATAAGFAMTPAYAGLGAAVSLPTSRPSVFAGTPALGAPSVSRTNNITVNVEGLLKARNGLDVARNLQRFADNGAFDPPENLR